MMLIKNLTPNHCHGVFLIQDNSTFLIDSGCNPNEFHEICQALKILNLNSIDYLILTHADGDHAANAKKLKETYHLTVLGGDNNQYADKFLPDGKLFLEDSLKLKIISTPGHSFAHEDISILITDTTKNKRYLFCGDIAQPCGADLRKSDYDTPIPLFHFPGEFIQSLEKLLYPENDFDLLITGHNQQLDRINGRHWLWITLESTHLLQSISQEILIRNPMASLEEQSKWVFDWFFNERGNPNKEKRMRYDYANFDGPIIKSMLNYVKKQLIKRNLL